MELKAYLLTADECSIMEICHADDTMALNKMKRSIKHLEETGSNDAKITPLYSLS